MVVSSGMRSRFKAAALDGRLVQRLFDRRVAETEPAVQSDARLASPSTGIPDDRLLPSGSAARSRHQPLPRYHLIHLDQE